MIKIGDFAKLFDVSVKTVRFYEEKGLLIPDYVDIYSGYRYYNEKNIEEMTVILNLKDLGFSLDEIKNYSKKDLEDKIKEYHHQIKSIHKKIHILKTFSEKEGSVSKMKKFIPDERVIGKWKLLGIASDKEDAIQQNFKEDDFAIRELYFLPDGQEYWVFSWTRGILYMNDVENKYELFDNLLHVEIKDNMNQNETKIAVYQNVDHNLYTRDEIQKKDDIQLPFVKDAEIHGFWKVIDYVRTPEQFSVGKCVRNPEELWLQKLIVSPNGDGIMVTKENKKECHYTKGYIFEFCQPHTASPYIYQKMNGKEYLIVAWKNGDYSYGGMIPGYYCFEREV